MISADVMITVFAAAFIIGGSVTAFYGRLTKIGGAFLVISLLGFGWSLMAGMTQGEEKCVDVTYYTVTKESLPNGGVKDVIVVDGRRVNVNAMLGYSIPEGHQVVRVTLEKESMGLKMYPRTKYKVVKSE